LLDLKEHAMHFARTSIAALAAFAASACTAVQGSGHVVGESRPAAPFHRLSLNGRADVQVVSGPVAGITVFTDDNLIPYIETRLQNDELTVAERDPRGEGPVWVLPSDGIRVMVTLPQDLTDVSVSGSGSVSYRNTSAARTAALRLAVSGSGSLDVAAAAEEIELDLSGSGSVHLAGSASRATVAVSGSGDVDAFDLPVGSALVDVWGSGLARVTALSSLEARVSGSGSILYRGAPAVTCSLSGSGSVRRE
jgi:hypothetical protein